MPQEGNSHQVWEGESNLTLLQAPNPSELGRFITPGAGATENSQG